MNIGINEFSNEDVFELSKVWDKLSDNMKEVISEAIGGKQSLSTIESIMYGFKMSKLDELSTDYVDKEVLLVNKNNSILTKEQSELFKELTINLSNFANVIRSNIKDIEKHDDDLTDLNN